MKKILFATDGSDSATKAAETAKQLLAAFPASVLIVLYVVKPIQLGMSMGMGAGMVMVNGMADEVQEITDATENLAVELEQDIYRQFATWKDRVSYKSVHGQPEERICALAEAEQVDLILVGSHGRGAIDRLLLGSVSHSVLNHATVSVLVVK